jgi:hypothetical protein
MNAPATQLVPAGIAAELEALDALIEAVREHRATLAREGRYNRPSLWTRADMGRAAMKVWEDGEIASDIDTCEHEARPFVPQDDTWKDVVPATGARHPFYPVNDCVFDEAAL